MFKYKAQVIPLAFMTLLICLPLNVLAQQENNKISPKLQTKMLVTKSQQTVTTFIYFKDKGDNIEQKLIAAKAALSTRSLQRRIINRGIDDVVGFADIPVNSDYVNLIKTQVNKVRHQLKAINAMSVEATPAVIESISKLDFVLRVDLVNKLKRIPEPQVIDELSKSSTDTLMKNLTNGLALDYGASFTQNEQINVPVVHDLGYSGNGVVIAIFDSGFNRLSHESFNTMDIADAWDFVNDDSDVGDATDMGRGSHGTNTLSTVGGYSPGNLIGPAFAATYYLAKTENTDSELHVEEDNWCAAADWADANGAQIITSSLGYVDFDTGANYAPSDMDGDTTVITICADLAAENGIVVINSAGNSGAGNGENTLGAPSDGHFVIAAGAVTSSGSRSSFSSVGPSADGRIKPDVMAMGSSVLVASANSDTGYSNVNGTSFSCPLTAGVAALVIESNPNLTAAQVRDILRNSGDQRATPDNSYGYGLLDAQAAVTAAIDAAGGSSAPNASFAVVTDGATSVFTNTSTDSDGTVDSFLWDFGDSNSSTDENPSHTYTSSGGYTVTLSVTDNDGMSDQVSRSVTATVASTPDPTPTPSSSSGGGSFGVILFSGLLIFVQKRKAVFKG